MTLRYFSKLLRRRSFRWMEQAAHSAEQGAVIVLFAIAMTTSFLIIALAIDGGHLFQQSLLLQKATDAAALTAAKALAVVPKEQQFTLGAGFIGDISTRIQQIGEENIKRQGTLSGTPVFELIGMTNPAEDLKRDRVTVRGRMRTKLYLMDKLLRYAPGFESALESVATAEVTRSLVGLIVDNSASMLCLPNTADCGCGARCNPKRISLLRQAIFGFVATFNEFRDKFYVNHFQAAAETLIGMDGVASTGFNPVDIVDRLRGLLQQGDSNPCDGIYVAWGNTQTAATAFGRSNWGRDYMAYVIFTDGAPTGARFFFNPASVLALPPTVNGRFDYYNWIVRYFPEGVWNAGMLGSPPMSLPWPLGSPPSSPVASPGCSARAAPSAALAFQGCVTNFDMQTPDGVVWPTALPPYAPAGVAPWPFYREQYFHCAIAMADMLRRQGAVVYTVGIGPAAANSTTDPYQNITEVEDRKDTFFRRLANDPRAYPEAYPPGSPTPPLFPGQFARYQGPADIPEWYSQGNYYQFDGTVPLDTILRQLRERIVRRIKTVQLVPTRLDDMTP